MSAARWTHLLDALYALDRVEGTWLAGVAEAARRAFDEGEGVAAYTWGMEPEPLVGLVQGDPEIARLPLTVHEEMPAHLVRLAYGTTPRSLPVSWAWATPAGPQLPPTFARRLKEHDLIDGFAVLSPVGTEGLAIGLGLPRRRLQQKAASGLDALSRRWDSIARHASLAFQLRRSLHAPHVRVGEHRALSGAALWEALLDGRWSIVQVTRRSGATEWVAVENPADDGLRAPGFTEREVLERSLRGQSLKAIALDLGLAESSVATSLSRALSRLGVGSVPELQRLRAGLASK